MAMAGNDSDKINGATDNKGNGVRNSGFWIVGNKKLDEQGLISLAQRICLQEEEEYQNMKAGWLDKCHESLTKEAPHGETTRASYCKDRFPANNTSSSSSSKKAKGKRKVSYGDICELFEVSTKIPGPLVRAQTIYCSRIALAHYNMKHCTDYKLVEPLLSGRAIDSGIGFHCNFTAAMLKKNSTPDDPKLFYADFRCLGSKATNIQCCIVDAATALYNHCRKCPPDLAHCPCGHHRHSLFHRKGTRKEVLDIDGTGSEYALAWYNKENGTAYKLVEPLRSNSKVIYRNRFLCLYHCNFIAKLKNPYNPDNVPPKIFFAEYVRNYPFTVVDCCIVDTAQPLDSFRYIRKDLGGNCRLCRGTVLHPPNYTGFDSAYWSKEIMAMAINCSGKVNGDRNDNENRVSAFWIVRNKKLDEQGLISLAERICLQEEEEYQNMKAGWLDKCHESLTKEAPHGETTRASYCKDRVPANNTYSSSSSKKAKGKRKVSYGDICELFEVSTKIPGPLVRAQTIFCSRIALAHYNMKHCRDYKLVEPLLSGRAIDSGIGFHCNFTAAKLKKNNTPSVPKLFYADFRFCSAKATNIQCCIVDGATARCWCCPPDLLHCPCKRHRLFLFYGMYRVESKEALREDVLGSKTALAWYNKKYGTAYKLLEALRCNPKVIDRNRNGVRRLCHSNFIAKLKNPCNPDDVSPKIFFAEYVKSTPIVVGDCCIVDTAEPLDSFRYRRNDLGGNCQLCRGTILHPPNYTHVPSEFDLMLECC